MVKINIPTPRFWLRKSDYLLEVEVEWFWKRIWNQRKILRHVLIMKNFFLQGWKALSCFLGLCERKPQNPKTPNSPTQLRSIGILRPSNFETRSCSFWSARRTDSETAISFSIWRGSWKVVRNFEIRKWEIWLSHVFAIGFDMKWFRCALWKFLKWSFEFDDGFEVKIEVART
jgi:hypothetical protein